MKDRINMKLMQVYQSSNSLSYTVEVATQLLKSNLHKNDKDFRATIHGEVAEVILVCGITEFMKNNHNLTKDWFFVKGLIIKDITKPNADFLTELDITLFTSNAIVLFECKSYGGSKLVSKEGTIHRNGKIVSNVFSQNNLHKTALHTNVEIANKDKNIKIPPRYKLVYFNFSIGSLKDIRTTADKKIMPVIDMTNLANYLSSIAKLDGISWNIETLKRISNIIEKNNKNRINKHLTYVKGKHTSKK